MHLPYESAAEATGHWLGEYIQKPMRGWRGSGHCVCSSCMLRGEVQSASPHHWTHMTKGNSPSAPAMEKHCVEVGALSSCSCGVANCVQHHAVAKAGDLFLLMPWREGLGPSSLLLSLTCSNLLILM